MIDGALLCKNGVYCKSTDGISQGQSTMSVSDLSMACISYSPTASVSSQSTAPSSIFIDCGRFAPTDGVQFRQVDGVHHRQTDGDFLGRSIDNVEFNSSNSLRFSVINSVSPGLVDSVRHVLSTTSMPDLSMALITDKLTPCILDQSMTFVTYELIAVSSDRLAMSIWGKSTAFISCLSTLFDSTPPTASIINPFTACIWKLIDSLHFGPDR